IRPYVNLACQYEAFQWSIAQPWLRQLEQINKSLAPVRELARSMELLNRNFVDRFKFDVVGIGNLIFSAFADFQEITLITSRVAGLLKPQITALQTQLRWNLDIWQKFVRQGGDSAGLLARWALDAALRAKDAALHGRTCEVDEFVEDYLELPVNEWRREAVISVLLSDDWLDEDLSDPTVPVTVGIKKLARREARNHKFLGDTQIAGRTLDSLDRTIVLPGGASVMLGEVVPAQPGGHRFDGRLEQLMERLNPDERRILLAFSEDNGCWGDAALAAGATREAGEAVRKKCKRLAAHQRCLAAAMTG
ncbi:MAG: hypothetical protein LC799_21285, partial [Actinobacteria bacterium]|nr:hypothetical protein [Actinomycetota bacterium]